MSLIKINNKSLDGNYGRRNLIINGAMQVAQRGTSSTGFVATANYLTVDRFKCENGSSGTFTVTQATDAPTGFSNSLKFDCTSADASPDYFLIVHRFEGQNLQHLEKGTSTSKKTTVSFHVKSNKTGTYQVNFRDVDNSRINGKTYTISTADTWEKKIVTFDGDISGTLGNDNNNSMQLEWWLASGSTYNSGAVPTAWEAIANGDRAAGLNVAIGASTDDEFLITGIQMEVGDKATDFEHRSYDEELAACQRYYSVPIPTGNLFCEPIDLSNNYRRASIAFPVSMRTSPTITVTGVSSIGFLTNRPQVDGSSNNQYVEINADGTGNGYSYLTNLTADAEL